MRCFAAVQIKLKKPEAAFVLPGFTSVQKCRKKGVGGGLAIYAKQPPKLMDMKTDSDDVLCTKISCQSMLQCT